MQLRVTDISRFVGSISVMVNLWHIPISLGLTVSLGPIVRFRPDSISINTAAAVGDIYGSRKANVAKSDWYRCIQYTAAGYASTFTIIDRARHMTKRRLLYHAFSDNALREMEPRVERQVCNWLDLFARHASKDCNFALDMGKWASYLVFDILADLCFGKPLGVMESSENRFLIPLVPRATRGWYTVRLGPTDVGI
jgi:cytochrome P450